jgi:hypothetical protein
MAQDQVMEAFLLSIAKESASKNSITINLAGAATQLCSNSPQFIEVLGSILGHLKSSLSPIVQVDFLLVSKELSLPWQWENGSYESDLVRALVDPVSGGVLIWDRRALRWFALFKEFDIVRTTPERLRSLLQLIAPRNTAAIHGGVVAWNGTGVLITAKGGSGKSSAVVGSLPHGAMTIGDDFLLTDPRENWAKGLVTLWSLFKTVRLGVTSPAYKLLSHPLASVSKNKELFDLGDAYPNSIQQRSVVRAIVVPQISQDAWQKQISADEAFAALAPSSVGLSLNRQQAIHDMQLLCSLLPAFRVTMTTDVADNAQRLRKITEQ